MSFFTILETLLLGPLKLVFEVIFAIANRITGNPGLSIIALSLIMNILVLPLYRRADVMQEEARDREALLHDGIAHIKKTFTGDERMMILQTYYRQNHYSPLSALNGSVSLLLEIPFFIAAYQFLSHIVGLEGVSFGPITDLSAPDGMLVLGGISINVLPILMTLINVISSAIYLKGFPLKTKIQLYAMAAFFLVFLYKSPSCLVFYWTLNNLFSLMKNVFYKLKNPQKILKALLFVFGAVVLVFGLFVYSSGTAKRKLFLYAVSVFTMLPFVVERLGLKLSMFENENAESPSYKHFFASGMFMTVFVGVLIPSAYLAASPQEFVDINYFHHPMLYILRTGTMAAGCFLVWAGVFYWISGKKGRIIFEKLFWILCVIMLINYMFFGTDLGIISPTLQYENTVAFSIIEQMVNLFVLVLIAIFMLLFARRIKKSVIMILVTALIATGGMSVYNFVQIDKSVDAIHLPNPEQLSANAEFKLSKQGNNVVVIMLDRAMGEYLPYLLNEKPELVQQFDGFTYYSNTISFGMATNFGSPALFGGYEYTPVEMNKRDTELLVDKHNEALKVMPVLFAENGYDVTVCDPVYANYQWIPDLSIYDEYDGIEAYITDGNTVNVAEEIQLIESNYRNFFCLALMKTMPLFVQPTIYDHGRYNQMVSTYDEVISSSQIVSGISQASGLSTAFMEPFDVLCRLSEMTVISEDSNNTFMMMCNDTTHEPMLLQEPDYLPAAVVDNLAYDAENADRFTLNGISMKVENDQHMKHYHINMAAMMQLGKWFDYLRENDVYDNTRIIVVSDHGRNLNQFEELLVDTNGGGITDVSLYYPLLLVKDFNTEGFMTSDAFMTNADVPTIAVRDLIEDAKNPFTRKRIDNSEKYAHDQFIIASTAWEVEDNNGTQYLASGWASVKENLWNRDNWTFCNDEIILDEHEMP